MKTKSLLYNAVALVLLQIPLVTPSWGISKVCMGVACTVDDPISPGNAIHYCTNYADSCYNGTRVRTCTKCQTGYTRTSNSVKPSGCSNSVTYYDCTKEEPDCDGTCDNCESTGWTKGANNTESRTVATCNTQTCICSRKVERRCAAGYYGTVGVIVSGSPCTQCPLPGTSAAGSTSQSDCYIPAGTTGSDSTGTYKYTSNCYY